jgi:hypothetical protein
MNISRCARIALLCLAAFFLPINSVVAHAATVPAGACLYALDPTADRAFQIAGAQPIYGVVRSDNRNFGVQNPKMTANTAKVTEIQNDSVQFGLRPSAPMQPITSFSSDYYQAGI